MSSDNEIRDLERRAATGDERAQEKLDRMNQRVGHGRHGDKIDKWVVVNGIRDHYQVVLRGVTELGGGRAILHCWPSYWLSSLANTDGRVQIPSSEENPFDVYTDGILGICIQPDHYES